MKKFVSFMGILGILMGIGSLAYGNEVTVYPGGATYTTIQAGITACPTDGTASVSTHNLY